MNILVTNFNYSGENVMIFNTSLSPLEVHGALKKQHQDFTDVHEVPDAETRFYLYEPLWATKSWDNSVRKKYHNK